MKNKNRCLIVLFLGLFQVKSIAQHIFIPASPAHCNSVQEKKQGINIQESVINDSILVEEIITLIREEANRNEMFRKGYGTIVLFAISPDKDKVKENVVGSYYLNVDYAALKDPKQDRRLNSSYPHFYTFISGRLVFIKLETLSTMFCSNFSKQSMKKLRRIQNKYLEPTERVTFYDSKGNKTFTDSQFRIDYHTLHAGRYMYIYDNNRYEVIQDPYQQK